MTNDLRALVAEHVADLRRCAVLLDPIAGLANTAAEIRKAADELQAALDAQAGMVLVPVEHCRSCNGAGWEGGDYTHGCCHSCGGTGKARENDGMMKDAARYQWLKRAGDVDLWKLQEDPTSEWDRLIDAAMLAAAPAGPVEGE